MKTKREMLKSVKNRKSKEASDLVSSILVQIEKSIYDNKRHCIVWVCLLDYSNDVIEKAREKLKSGGWSNHLYSLGLIKWITIDL